MWFVWSYAQNPQSQAEIPGLALSWEERFATNQSLGRPQTIHGRLNNQMCMFSDMFGFLPELLSSCLWTICLTTNCVSMVDVLVCWFQMVFFALQKINCRTLMQCACRQYSIKAKLTEVGCNECSEEKHFLPSMFPFKHFFPLDSFTTIDVFLKELKKGARWKFNVTWPLSPLSSVLFS